MTAVVGLLLAVAVIAFYGGLAFGIALAARKHR